MIIEQIKYMYQFKSTFKYKIGYIYSSFIKFIIFLFKKDFKYSKFPFNGNFVIKNNIGIFKIYEPSDMHSILNPNSEKELLKYFRLDGGIFLDIGTNIGKYSVYVGKQNKNNLVYSFEPNTYLFNNYLKENIKLNKLSNIKLNNVGLSNKEGQFTLCVPDNNFGSGSINNKYENGKKYNIKTIVLDNFIKENKINFFDIKLIKIDVEGHEYNVLSGAKDTFKRLKGCILIIELFQKSKTFNKTIDLIKSFGFKQKDKLYGDNYIFYKK